MVTSFPASIVKVELATSNTWKIIQFDSVAEPDAI